MVQGSNLSKGKRFLSFPETSGQAMWSTHPPIHWVPVFIPGGKAAAFDFNLYLFLVPRLRMSRAVPLVPLDAFMAWPGKMSTLPAVLALIA